MLPHAERLLRTVAPPQFDAVPECKLDLGVHDAAALAFMMRRLPRARPGEFHRTMASLVTYRNVEEPPGVMAMFPENKTRQ